MLKIRELSKEQASNPELLRDTKAQFDDLMRQKGRLEREQKSLNPFKLFALHRAKRLFLDAGRELYISTRTTSERMKRALLSMASTDVISTEGESIAKDERIAGISVELNGTLTEETATFFEETARILASSGDPFADPSPTSGEDDQSSTVESTIDPVETLSSARSSLSVSSPTSPRSTASINYFNVNYNYSTSVLNSNSSASGLTINSGGSRNSGSVVHHVSGDPSP
ncbi:hypothetical protein PAXINDRAFT_168240 [Paxillus involutus ATCC 200175]|nr:hypothetical protein PAXINDRAFT_168240 [Paxillus involutus ATCC 200175]